MKLEKLEEKILKIKESVDIKLEKQEEEIQKIKEREKR